MRIVTPRRLWLEQRAFVAVRVSLTAPARVTGSFVASDGSTVAGQSIATPTRRAGATLLRLPLKITRPGLYKLQLRAAGLGQTADRTATIRFLRAKPASPVWQDGPPRVAVVQGAGGLASLGRLLGRGFVVEQVADSALYDAVDTNYRTAAAAVVVDLGTIPRGTLAGLHALLPEVKIVGLAPEVKRTNAARPVSGVAALLPRHASPALVARTVERLLRR
jgi:hypothetical protein